MVGEAPFRAILLQSQKGSVKQAGGGHVMLIHFIRENIKTPGSQHCLQVLKFQWAVWKLSPSLLPLSPIFIAQCHNNPNPFRTETLQCGVFSRSWLQMIYNFNNICLFPEKGFYLHSMPMLF